MNKKTKRTIVIIAAALLLIAAAVTIFLVVNANSTGYRSISIADIFGRVMTQNGGKTYEAYKNMRLADGYALTTDPDSYTRMVLDDDKYVKLEQESHAIFEALGNSKRHLTTIRLEKGALTTEITKPLSETESYVVNTPNAVLAVRGTLFRVEVKQEANSDYYCDVYTYGGSVVSHRIMPDGTHVDEEIVIPAGYKATIKMDEIITVYLEEEIEEKADNIDPLHISEVNDDDLVAVYNASRHGHEMFLPAEELWNEISDRDIDLSKYKSVYDGADIPPFNSGNIGNSDSASDNSIGNSESSSDSSDITDSSNISDSSEQDGGDSSDDNSSSPTFERPGELSSAPSGSDDDNTHDADPESRPPQSSSATASVSEPTPPESTPGASVETSSDTSDSSSLNTSSSGGSIEPVESDTSSSTDSGNSGNSSDNTSSDTPPTPPAHTHAPEETRVEPTCVENGRITRKCSVCGELLNETVISAKGHTETSKTTSATCVEGGKVLYFCDVCGIILRTVDIPALGHTEVTSTTPATCTESGKTLVECGMCNEILNETVIPAKGHTFGEYISNNNATCIKDGTKTALCEVCGERDTITDEGSILPHTPETVTVPSTCTKHGSETVICKVCETIITPKKELPLAEHTEVTKTVDPACAENGKTIVTCSVCNETLREDIIPATGHSFGEYNSDNNATCIKDGTKTALCEVCGERDTITDEGSILPHTPETVTVPSTCTKHGSETVICKVCETIITPEKEFPLAEHTEVAETVDPTCTVNGKTIVTCSVCNETLRGDIISATGHSFGEYKSDNNSTCIKDGTKTALCTDCGERNTITDEGSILPHTPETVTVPSTCTEHGSETVICKICETIITPKKELPLAEHTEVTETVDPTCTENGKTIVACSVCGEIIDETVIDALGHDYEDKITKPASCTEEGAKVTVCTRCDEEKPDSLTVIEKLPHTKITEEANGISTVRCEICGEIITQTDLSTGITYPVEISGIFPDFVPQNIADSDKDNDGKLSLDECRAITELSFGEGETDVGYGDALEQLVIFPELANINITAMITDGNLSIGSIGGLNDTNISNVTGGTYPSDTAGVIKGITAGTDIGCDYTMEDGRTIPVRFIPAEGSTFAPETPEGVAINAENFPDEVFREYVMTNFDTDGDGYLSQEECDAVTEINVSGTSSTNGGIASLNGIEDFTKLKELRCYYNSGLTEIDVSNNTALETLACDNTQITSLDVSNNTALAYLDCYNTPITSLDVSNNTALETLRCFNTPITSIDISNNTALAYLDCCNTPITSLDVSNNTVLETLRCFITQITSLDVSKNTALTYLNCNRTPITSLDVGENTALEYLSCTRTQITSLDVSNNTALEYLDCSNTQIPFVDIGNNPNISTFNADGCEHTIHVENGVFDLNSIDGFDISRIIGMVEGMDENGVISGITEGSYITYIYDCKGTGESAFQVEFTLVPDESSTFATETPEITYPVPIDEEHFPDEKFRTYVSTNFDTDGDGYLSQEECDAVTEIYVSGSSTSSSMDGGITSLKGIENFIKLVALSCGYNIGLTELDVSKNTALTTLSCHGTQITSLDLSKNTALKYLYCRDTQITSLDVSKNTTLEYLYCYKMPITSLDVSKNTALKYLYCDNTQITSLDVSKNTALTQLDCSYTPITSLDVSKNTVLTKLYCNNAQISFVDVSNCSSYSSFSAYGNKHPIHVENGVFDLKSIDGFDISRIVGDVEGMDENGVISGITKGTNITYTYDCRGTGESKFQAEFTLVPDESSTFAPEPPEITYPVPIDEEHFPDEKFRTYVSTNFDTDGNGYLSQEECEAVKKIDVSGTESTSGGITSLKGIEHFIKLNELYCGYNLDLTTLDVSNNKALTYLDCSYDFFITGLDLSNNTSLEYLNCECCISIENLDVSKNTKLTNLNCTSTKISELDVSNNTELTELNCSSNQIGKLDVSNNTELTKLNCYGNQIVELDASKNTMLTELNCSSNQIGELDISKNTVLTELYCGSNPIVALDVSRNTMLTRLNCGNTQISELDVSQNTALTWLGCAETQLAFVDTSNCHNLISFGSYFNSRPITVMNGTFDTKTIKGFNPDMVFDLDGAVWGEDGILVGIVENTEISYNYDCKGTGELDFKGIFTLVPDESSTFAPEPPEITYPVPIDEEHFPDPKFREYVTTNFDTDSNGELSQFECNRVTRIEVNGSSSTDGGITSLVGIENFGKLKMLYCYYNSGLTELDLSNNTTLDFLLCNNTQITSLDVRNNTALTYLDCSETQITSLDVSNNTALTGLDCSNTQVTSLDVSKNTALTDLVCYGTEITSLDVSNNTALRYLECCNTQITLLDVSNNTALTYLDCQNIQITLLDVSNNTALKQLECSNTQIASLDVSNNPVLTDLECFYAQIPFIDISNNPNLTSFVAHGNKYPISVGALQFDVTSDINFQCFDPTRVSDVIGADFDPESGIFDNFTADEIIYTYDCKGTGESDYMVTFTLVRTDSLSTASISEDSDDDTPAVLPPDDTNTTPPNAPEEADGAMNADAALPPEDIEGLRFLPLGILALANYRKRKTAFRIKRKAEI